MHEVAMPKLTHDMRSGIFLEWLKAEGEMVQRGESLFAVETDKAAVTVEAEASGVLCGVGVRRGEEVPVGTLLAYLLAEGESAPPDALAPSRPARGSVPIAPEAEPSPKGGARSDFPRPPARPAASPIARRIAQERGIDLSRVRGSGPAGLITERDVHALLEAQGAPTRSSVQVPQSLYEVVALTGVQRSAGRRLAESMREIPFFDLEAEIDMNAACRLRASSAEELSYTAVFLHAAARALRDHPRLNAHFLDGELRSYHDINIGVAVATDSGLIVPVIHQADRRSLPELQSTLTELQGKAKVGRFAALDLSGGTFTLSNLGMSGVDTFRAILNPPEVAILAVGRVVDRPVVRQGQIVVRPTVHVSLSVDHRALDGSTAAPFLERFRELLETL